MWYRFYKEAVRVLKTPEFSWHKTPNENVFYPIWSLDPHNLDPTSAYGSRSKVRGPGHYTSQNPYVREGYNYKFQRREKLPRGTRILNDDNIPEEDFYRIRDKILELSDKKLYDHNDTEFNLMRLQTYLDTDHQNEIFPLLVSMGYDAIEYKPFEKWNVPRKENETDEQYELRVKKVRSKGLNVLILNRAILIDPKLFTRSRYRPETLTYEEIDKLQKIMFVSQYDVWETLYDAGKIDSSSKPDDALLQVTLDKKDKDLFVRFYDRLSYVYNTLDLEKLVTATQIFGCEIIQKLFNNYSNSITSDQYLELFSKIKCPIDFMKHIRLKTVSIELIKEIINGFEPDKYFERISEFIKINDDLGIKYDSLEAVEFLENIGFDIPRSKPYYSPEDFRHGQEYDTFTKMQNLIDPSKYFLDANLKFISPDDFGTWFELIGVATNSQEVNRCIDYIGKENFINKIKTKNPAQLSRDLVAKNNYNALSGIYPEIAAEIFKIGEKAKDDDWEKRYFDIQRYIPFGNALQTLDYCLKLVELGLDPKIVFDKIKYVFYMKNQPLSSMQKVFDFVYQNLLSSDYNLTDLLRDIYKNKGLLSYAFNNYPIDPKIIFESYTFLNILFDQELHDIDFNTMIDKVPDKSVNFDNFNRLRFRFWENLERLMKIFPKFDKPLDLGEIAMLSADKGNNLIDILNKAFDTCGVNPNKLYLLPFIYDHNPNIDITFAQLLKNKFPELKFDEHGILQLEKSNIDDNLKQQLLELFK